MYTVYTIHYYTLVCSITHYVFLSMSLPHFNTWDMWLPSLERLGDIGNRPGGWENGNKTCRFPSGSTNGGMQLPWRILRVPMPPAPYGLRQHAGAKSSNHCCTVPRTPEQSGQRRKAQGHIFRTLMFFFKLLLRFFLQMTAETWGQEILESVPEQSNGLSESKGWGASTCEVTNIWRARTSTSRQDTPGLTSR